MDNVLINHERIHIRQQLELYIILFTFYTLSIIISIEENIKATMNLNTGGHIGTYLFEKEDSTNQNNLDYLKTRKKYEYRKYI